MGRVRVYVGLGANIGDAADTLAAAIHALAALPGVRLAGVSRLYATAPVGVTDQPEFRNAVVALDVPGGRDPVTGALALLVALKGLERAFGRRDGPRWGPRALDLDLLVFGRHAIRAERPPEARSDDPARVDHPARAAAQWLTVPHASARERLFVLAPLADLAPGLRPPGWGETVAAARRRAELCEGSSAARPISEWDAAVGAWATLRPPACRDGAARRSGRPTNGASIKGGPSAVGAADVAEDRTVGPARSSITATIRSRPPRKGMLDEAAVPLTRDDAVRRLPITPADGIRVREHGFAGETGFRRRCERACP